MIEERLGASPLYRLPHREDDGCGETVEERLLWDVLSLSVQLIRISELWGKRIDVSGSQWMILMAIRLLDQGSGIAVKEVAAFLNADASFVTTQSKILEKKRMVNRVQSESDRRSVLMSLTNKADEQLESLAPSRLKFQEFVRAEIDGEALTMLSSTMAQLRERIDKAALLLAAGA